MGDRTDDEARGEIGDEAQIISGAAGALDALFACPLCGRAPTPSPGGLTCGCGAAFPDIGGMRCLWPDGEAMRAEIAEASYAHLERVAASIARTEPQLARDLMPATRARVTATVEAMRHAADDLRAQLAALGISPASAPPRPARFHPLSGQQALLRDWGWSGGEHPENRISLDLLRRALDGDEPLGRVLVIGAGGGRLGFDLHHAGGADLTVLLDLNPLVLSIAQRVVRGRDERLWDFPPAPRSGADAGVEVVLPGRRESSTLISFVVADGLALPFVRGAFDTVVTPWFIDQVPRDLRAFLAQVAFVLAPGGRWVNLGPLLYPAHVAAAERYPLEEIEALVAAEGWEMSPTLVERQEYLASPASAQARLEDVVAFTARRAGSSPERPAPPWLVRSDEPIPRLPWLARSSPAHPAVRLVASLIDGRRTADDIATALVQRLGIPPSGAADGIRQTVAELHRLAAQARGPAA